MKSMINTPKGHLTQTRDVLQLDELSTHCWPLKKREKKISHRAEVNLVLITYRAQEKKSQNRPLSREKKQSTNQTRNSDLFRQQMCTYLFELKPAFPNWIWKLVWGRKRKFWNVKIILFHHSELKHFCFLKPVSRELTCNLFLIHKMGLNSGI